MDSVVETLKEQLKSGKVAVKFVNVDWTERNCYEKGIKN